MLNLNVIQLNILSLNLHAGVNWLGRFDLEGIIDLIRSVNPDFCGLQEVDCHWSKRSGYQDLAAILARELQMYSHFAASLSIGRGAYGNLILSRYPILDRWVYRLPSHLEPRSLGCVQAMVAGMQVVFMTTHLGLNDEERRRQTKRIQQLVRQCLDPVIITGDFNADYQTPAVQTLSAGLSDMQLLSPLAKMGTFRLKDGSLGPRIDYILATSEFVLEDFQILDSYISDHLPVVAKLRLETSYRLSTGKTVFYQGNHF